jgi:quinol-cytochrome oxidoreductase complex cytochrome b subunit
MFATLGAIFVAEIVVLSYWGLVTPGRTIPNEQALFVLGGTALLISILSLMLYRLVFRGLIRASGSANARPTLPTRSAPVFTGGCFVLILAVGALSIGGLLNSVVELTLGANPITLGSFLLSLAGLASSVAGTIYLLYRLDYRTGAIKRRVRILEVGLN